MLKRLIKHISKGLNQRRKRHSPLLQTPFVDDKHFLFIGGLHRSGTTVLHQLLREHPLASGFDDTGAPRDEGQHLQSVIPTAHAYGGAGDFAFYPAAHLTESSELISPDSRDILLKEWGAYYDLQKQILLEKSPPNLIRSRFFRQLLPNSSFVFIVRHPIAVSLATEKWSKRSITERLLHWHTAESIMLDDIRALSDCLVIRYEDFVTDPQAYLDEICRMLSISGFMPQTEVVNHNEKYFSLWEQRHASDLETLKAVLPATCITLEEFGYTLDGPYIK